MIDERLQEQAALHVLGALSPTEAREFKQALRNNSELKKFVGTLTSSVGALAGSVTATEPPPQLRAKILASVGEKQKMILLPERKPIFPVWLAWSLGLFMTMLCILEFKEHKRLRDIVYTQTSIISDLNRFVTTLQSATNDLQQAVLALQATNRLANLRIAMLGSLLADSPKAVAVSMWDDAKQEGVFVVQNLKPLPADRDYQLWVLDNGTTPVDAGVFRVDGSGTVRVEFKTKSLIKVAGKFAVTEEVRGGVPSPTIKNMVLVGN